ncbi:PREDICTED: protein C8orf37 homolog [Nanorana parkeri]|uniref:protein C8orf37 homolog n=1 Tax=Nanorana parkeri TaxID=125878 RepID=UPI000854B62B|nr:PREDICTED: protein C8orf37 homolog [Nanorana parkeri]
MADDDDDLDKLLDEVESKYCQPQAGTRGAAGRTAGGGKRELGRSKNTVVNVSTDEEDVDNLIEDILDDHLHKDNKAHRTKPANQKPSNIANQPHNKKCCPVYLGGTMISFGFGTHISERACSQLRCTSCDFSVLSFDDYKWDSSCDYLFFRNSMPEHSKLQSKMIRKKGTRAYACQCSWRSVYELTDLSKELQLRWVCGKHSE